ncbi:RNA-binding protein [Ramlibacter sp.]|uniref:RNA-binding protein n=1 Tax=Ramlibacter sp. TaxID=1917967 RepID=UPI002CAFB317|nr:RNA-binding protein [Ramlibacter sp.]HWI82074.1 RNA-binding protein [Ramlibacter sp.]
MKPFAIEPGMLTLRGVFYPTGHLFLMFPTEQDARNAERALEDAGHSGEHICLLTPAEIRDKIGRTVASEDAPLPSPGTEVETVRRFDELAHQGHYGLLIHAPSHDETEHIMQTLRGHPVSYGQKYRHLVIEDLVT